MHSLFQESAVQICHQIVRHSYSVSDHAELTIVVANYGVNHKNLFFNGGTFVRHYHYVVPDLQAATVSELERNLSVSLHYLLSAFVDDLQSQEWLKFFFADYQNIVIRGGTFVEHYHHPPDFTTELKRNASELLTHLLLKTCKLRIFSQVSLRTTTMQSSLAALLKVAFHPTWIPSYKQPRS